MYSALKQGGKRLYQLARAGIEVERPAREIEIHEINLTWWDEPAGRYTIDVRCSKGTYIRTLCHDLGKQLGCGGVMESLRRTEACSFALGYKAYTLEQLQELTDEGQFYKALQPISCAFYTLPTLCLDERATRLFENGVKLELSSPGVRPLPHIWKRSFSEGGAVCVLGSQPHRNFLGLGVTQGGQLGHLRLLGAQYKLSAKGNTAPLELSRDLAGPSLPLSGSCVALGLFCGLHIGHAAVIKRTVELACVDGLTPLVFTFTAAEGSHPGKESMSDLLSFEATCHTLESYGIRGMVCPDFEQFREFSPERFVREILTERLGAARVVCGEDFRFGKGAAGDIETLRELCAQVGIIAEALPPVRYDGQTVSSRKIRRLVERGAMQTAHRMLGSPFSIDFEVVSGRQLGRTLGLPTINQAFPLGFTIPRFGVYETTVSVGERCYQGITNVGVKPTTGQPHSPLCETHILGFEGDLYGQRVTVRFLEFVRDERKFESIEELQAAVLADIAEGQIAAIHAQHDERPRDAEDGGRFCRAQFLIFGKDCHALAAEQACDQRLDGSGGRRRQCEGLILTVPAPRDRPSPTWAEATPSCGPGPKGRRT